MHPWTTQATSSYEPLPGPSQRCQINEIARAWWSPNVRDSDRWGVVRTGTDHWPANSVILLALFMHSLTAANVTGSEHSLGIAGDSPQNISCPPQAADMVLILGDEF